MGHGHFGRVGETTSSTGTGDLTLAGAIAGFRAVGDAHGDGDTFWAVVADADNAGDWEICKLTYTASGNLVTRTQVYINSDGTTSARNWGAGDKVIYETLPGLSDLDAAGLLLLRDLSINAAVTVASASTCNILGAVSDQVLISGTTTITSFGAGPNRLRFVTFEGALTLTHNGTSLILPGGVNITTAAGDTCIVVADASSNARVLAYQRGARSPIGYQLGSTQVFTSSGTWTKPAGCRAVKVRIRGGGGGGGYAATGTAAAGGGGGQGEYAEKWVTSPGATETVTIGAGGTGGVGSTTTDGAAGGTTSFGAHVTAAGGSPGSGDGSGGGDTGRNGGAGGSGGSGGDLAASGAPGIPGLRFGTTPAAIGGAGGGEGGGATVTDDNHGNAGAKGGGGGGGASTSANRNGGAGGDGWVIVEEFY